MLLATWVAERQEVILVEEEATQIFPLGPKLLTLGTHWSPGSAWQRAKGRATHIHWVNELIQQEVENVG